MSKRATEAVKKLKEVHEREMEVMRQLLRYSSWGLPELLHLYKNKKFRLR